MAELVKESRGIIVNVYVTFFSFIIYSLEVSETPVSLAAYAVYNMPWFIDSICPPSLFVNKIAKVFVGNVEAGLVTELAVK